MKFVRNFFFSMASALVLFLIFAFFSALATFIESAHGTQTAWALIYGTAWFGAIQLWLGLNLAYNIFHYKLFSMKKLPALVFHASFLFILVGAGLTRYAGFEGLLHIRENSQNNVIETSQSYILFRGVGAENFTKKPVYISFLGDSILGRNSFNLKTAGADGQAILRYADFIENGVPAWVESQNGRPVLEILFSNDKNSRAVTLLGGESIEVGDISVSFDANATLEKFIKITLENGEFFIETNQKISFMKMADMSRGELPINEKVAFRGLRLYSVDGVNFAPRVMLKNGERGVKMADEKTPGVPTIIAEISYKNSVKKVALFSGASAQKVEFGGEIFEVAWAPMAVNLPFWLYLADFKLDRYPGSNSPMSYSSDIIVRDGNFSLPYKIYMNHVLDYRGYRFFQSSYDMDEGGTILSVNRDPGKIPTYIGYFLLAAGLLLNIFNPNSRFNILARKVNAANSENLAKKGKK